ncbi:spore germination protein, partial [Eubacteriales bacterium OttesenSCG-928-M02]|nr:spore germination protein [Eubacteriales bacterium OttesenSCG-928-M02]
LLIENFQSNEDYYVNTYYASMSRILRIFGFFLTILVPAVYIAIVTYHHEIMPASLMIDLMKEREMVPLPAALECFIMLIVFDILKETGIRLPSQIGQALSIVGALVIGQAAVEAHLVAAPMVIVVAFTGITNLLVPKLNASAWLCRYLFLILASALGLLGLVLGISVLIIHILNLTSFGIPIGTPLGNLKFQELKDTIIRAPWPSMLTRIFPLSNNHRRMKQKKAGG